jgi:hypothetical protein
MNTLSGAAPAADDIPGFLDAKNRKPLTPEQRARLDEVSRSAMSAPNPDAEAAAKVKADLEARKRQKATVRKEKRDAAKTGTSSAMPLSGKDAARAIAGKPKKPAGKKAKPKAKGAKPSKPAKPAKSPKPKAAKPPKAPSKPKEATAVRSGTKLEVIVALLTRPEGCVASEVLKATNWPSVSMPQQAKAAGLVLRTEKEGRVTRYWGTPKPAEAPATA